MKTHTNKDILKHISLKYLAEEINMNYSLLRQYACGIKTPSKKQKERINKGIKELAKELINFEI